MSTVTPVSFSLDFCSVNFSNVTMSGFAEGDGMVLEFPDDDFEFQHSSDGLIIAIKKHNVACDGMIRLGQGNLLITVMRQLHEASLAAGGIWYPFFAKNLKSPDEVAAGSAMLTKRIPFKWSDTAQPAEIPFKLAVTQFAGGTLLA